MKKSLVVLASVALAVGLLILSSYTDDISKAQAQTAPTRPNIVFVLTDDQPKSTLSHMRVLNTRLKEQGMTFETTVVSNPLCCPSRATLQRGQYTHNHQVFQNKSPYGG